MTESHGNPSEAPLRGASTGSATGPLRKKARWRAPRVLARCVWHLAVTALIVVTLLPLVWALQASLLPMEEVYRFPPRLSMVEAQWSNYRQAATQLPLVRFLLNSLWISFAGVCGAVLTASMAGFALARLRWRGRQVWFVLVVVSLIVPAQVLLIPRFLLFDALGWVGTYKPLIVPAWLGGGAFNVLLFRQFFLTIPRTFDDAARLDGASTWQTFRHVLLPMSKPAVITAALLSFVVHWQEFLDPLVYLSDFRTYPISLGLRMYQSLAGTWINLLMAASIISLAPVALLFVLFHRRAMSALRYETGL